MPTAQLRGTFVGAVSFLVGALLLLPERTEPQPAQEPALDCGHPQ
jgi:hypothetical protein